MIPKSEIHSHPRTCEVIAANQPWPDDSRGILSFKFLSYDDVQIVPGHGSNNHRADIDIRSQLIRGGSFPLAIPVLTSNMDTVTEFPMAIAAARCGALGVLHRNMSIEEVSRQVEKVKTAQGYVIYSPEKMRVEPHTTVQDADRLMADNRLGFVLVYEGDELVGIATPKDILAAEEYGFPISSVMTKQVVTMPEGSPKDDVLKDMRQRRIEKMVLVSSEGKVSGVATLRNWEEARKYPNATVDSSGRLRVGISVGIDSPGEALERAQEGIRAGADVIFVDAANVDHEKAWKTLEFLAKRKTELGPIIAGNVTTPRAVRDLIDKFGVDAVKGLVGPGSLCITRIQTGAGLPAFTSVAHCAAEAWKDDVPFIADGGIQYNGDVAKAIGAGASTVMVGGALVATDEAPGRIRRNGEFSVKFARGMSTQSARDGLVRYKDDKNQKPVNEEGVEASAPLKGPASDIIYALGNGLRGGMAYSGGPPDMDVDYFQRTVLFAEQTSAGEKEGKSRL